MEDLDKGPALIKDLVNLRRKIAVASVLGLRVAKVAIALFVIAVIAVTLFAVVASRRAQDKIAQQSEELENLKQFKTGWENHEEQMKRRTYESYERSVKAVEKSRGRRRQREADKRQEDLKK